MTDEEENKLGLTHEQRIIYEYFESHPEALERLTEALRPAIEALTDIYVRISEALIPIINALGPILIDDEENNEEDPEDEI